MSGARLPTDLKILHAIYRRYYDQFAGFAKGTTRSHKNYVPIDIESIAQDLKVDGDILFGRLYYHLEHKYAYCQDDGAQVHFFALRIGDDVHCVNFPLMASVLADLQDQSRRHSIAIVIAIGALILSAVSVAVSILR